MPAGDFGRYPGESLGSMEALPSRRLVGLDRASDLMAPPAFAFADHGTDEFTVTREDGSRQGIFKVWATATIAERETGLVGQAAETRWAEDMREKPLGVFQVLEKWRARCELDDARLQRIYGERGLPSDPHDAAAELFGRLTVAFEYSEPFYSLEALVADTRGNSQRNPLLASSHEVDTNASGTLDAVAMVLPSALEGVLTADTLDWKGLSWSQIDQQVATLQKAFMDNPASTAGRQFAALARVADHAGLPIADVLFGANALQFIPANVGGKVGDLPAEDALRALEDLMKPTRGATTQQAVAADMNAAIRFRNWTPAVRSERNFSGAEWAYGAVCDTASQLYELVEQHAAELLEPDFAAIFTDVLAPQLREVDASSARGRFMLSLLQEGRFKPSLTRQIQRTITRFASETGRAMDRIAREHAVTRVGDGLPTQLVGGKVKGLERALDVFGKDAVVGGSVINSEVTTQWLLTLPGVGGLIDQLNKAKNIDDKITIGQKIEAQIMSTQFPAEVVTQLLAGHSGDIVARSSSADEDVNTIGPAPGVYESVVGVASRDLKGVNAAIRTVIASYFSEKAISYRELKGLQHDPQMAVLVQDFERGNGGYAFVRDGVVDMTTAFTPEHINAVDAGQLTEHVTLHAAHGNTDGGQFLNASQIDQARRFALRSERVYGPSDLEFVVGPNGRVQLLQLRKLEVAPEMTQRNRATSALGRITLDDVGDLADLPMPHGTGRLELKLSDRIDPSAFQGGLLRWLVTNRDRVARIVVGNKIPTTCHFVNIARSLGISVDFPS